MKQGVLVLVVAAAASGCISTRAQVPVERPALEVPPAPPRIVEPPPAPEFVGIDPVPQLAEQQPEPSPASQKKPPPPRDAAAKEPPKPEPKPESPTEVVEEVAQAQNNVPVPLLRTQATKDAAAVAGQINATLDRARTGLEDVDYTRLSETRKKWYNEAKDFITSAERELKASNLELAKELANKAQIHATMLQGR